MEANAVKQKSMLSNLIKRLLVILAFSFVLKQIGFLESADGMTDPYAIPQLTMADKECCSYRNRPSEASCSKCQICNGNNQDAKSCSKDSKIHVWSVCVPAM